MRLNNKDIDLTGLWVVWEEDDYQNPNELVGYIGSKEACMQEIKTRLDEQTGPIIMSQLLNHRAFSATISLKEESVDPAEINI